MNDFADHAQGIAEIIAGLGEDCPVIGYAGKVVRVYPSAGKRAGNLSVGGMELDSDLTFTALLADFPKTPESNQKFSYTGKQYRIDSVSFAPGGLQIRVTATDAAKGM